MLLYFLGPPNARYLGYRRRRGGFAEAALPVPIATSATLTNLFTEQYSVLGARLAETRPAPPSVLGRDCESGCGRWPLAAGRRCCCWLTGCCCCMGRIAAAIWPAGHCIRWTLGGRPTAAAAEHAIPSYATPARTLLMHRTTGPGPLGSDGRLASSPWLAGRPRRHAERPKWPTRRYGVLAWVGCRVSGPGAVACGPMPRVCCCIWSLETGTPLPSRFSLALSVSGWGGGSGSSSHLIF